MGCNNFLTEEDDRLMAEHEGKNCCQLDPEIQAQIERDMPAVERAIAERCVECLEENAENVTNNINEQIVQKGEELTDLDKIDQEVWPTHQQLDEMVGIGKELGLRETEIISTPLICGTDNVENMSEMTRETMNVLHTSKLAPMLKDDQITTKIIFVGKVEPGSDEEHIAPEKTTLQQIDEKTQKEKGQSIAVFWTKPGEFPKRNELKRVLTHGMVHRADIDIVGRINEHHEEWLSACKAQAKQGPVSKYMEEKIRDYIKGTGGQAFEAIRDHHEIASECIAFWDIDSPELCPEMREFFDEHLT